MRQNRGMMIEDESEGESNERKILKSFILEFNPIYTESELENINYNELVNIVKEIVKDKL